MVRMSFLIVAAGCIFLLPSCSASNFQSNGSKSSDDKKQPSSQNAEPIPASSEAPPASPESTVTSAPTSEDLSTCWAAVSGVIFSAKSFKGLLPPEGSKSKLDAVLRPGSTYAYQQGNRELDQVIDNSFDNLIVSPGVSVELFIPGKTTPHQVINGPAYGLTMTEAEYPGTRKLLGDMFRSKDQDYPPWLIGFPDQRAPVDSKDWQLVRTIKVSKIVGTSCK